MRNFSFSFPLNPVGFQRRLNGSFSIGSGEKSNLCSIGNGGNLRGRKGRKDQNKKNKERRDTETHKTSSHTTSKRQANEITWKATG